LLDRVVNLHGLSVFCLTKYEGAVQKALWQLKLRKRREVLPFLLNLMNQYCPVSDTSVDVVIPVPLHPRRAQERGFNQSELLIREVASQREWPVLNEVVSRKKATRPLYDLNSIQRKTEIHDAFELREPAAITGKHVWVFDDIVTTGTTFNELNRILQLARPASVRFLALAHPV
jgi:ComF family protein